MSVALAGVLVVSARGQTVEPGDAQGQPPKRELPAQWSGIYPNLAMFNSDGECGTGAVVPWAGSLWAITYSPHKPRGSGDKLYQISPDLQQTVRPESVGGTHANRMIHRESKQLFIGPYVVDQKGGVRVIQPADMPGRLTGTARHLHEPAEQVYFATMEEGFYEVDVKTLAVNLLYPDGNAIGNVANDLLPGYHGKGLHTAQGRLVYANNGEHTAEARIRPDVPSGCLAAWDGNDWKVVRRNQFTEVTGPGGISGNTDAGDPLWSIGWDHRSLILMLLDDGTWHSFRLPKASHCYDGAHGWNTEWPRIREIRTGGVGGASEGGDGQGQGDDALLMTMHGMFWRFPRTFSAGNTQGIAPRSTYLKVIGDFAGWQGRVVFGCDDTAKNEFLNTRKAKGTLASPGQSQSNLWFVDPERLDSFGPPLGRGAVWVQDPVQADQPSEPFLFAGFHRRAAHLTHDSVLPVTFRFEIDPGGDGKWSALREVTVPAKGYAWVDLTDAPHAPWVRIALDRDVTQATAWFNYSNRDPRTTEAADIFAGLAPHDATQYTGGLVRARGADKRTLHLAAAKAEGGQAGGARASDVGYYELGEHMQLRKADDPQAFSWMKQNVGIPTDVLTIDAASVLYIDDNGNRFRLPKSTVLGDEPPALPERIDREVCTERDLFNAHGTFYELPARNAGGFAKIRPVASHNRHITDYCSYRGLLVMTGISPPGDGDESNPHVIRSADGKAAVWVGAVDDLWQFGKPVGRGGPWNDAQVKAGQPSDPYLMTGYDRKTLALSHGNGQPITIRIEIDITGNGDWATYKSFNVPAGKTVTHVFPDAFAAYWVRAVATTDARATATLTYE